MLHIRAFKAGPPTLVLVGDGKLDYMPVFAAAAKAGVEQYYVEQEPPFAEMTALEAIKVGYDSLHALEV